MSVPSLVSVIRAFQAMPVLFYNPSICKSSYIPLQTNSLPQPELFIMNDAVDAGVDCVTHRNRLGVDNGFSSLSNF